MAKRHLQKSLAEPKPEHSFVAWTEDAKAEISKPVLLQEGYAEAAASLAGTGVDMVMVADLGAVFALGANTSVFIASQRGESGPATLAEYCAGPTQQEQGSKLKEGAKVKANWEGYGTMYPGKISDKNRDGTVDIKYDDGFTEKRVDVDDLKMRKSKKEKAEAKKAAKPRDDPACKLQDFLKKLQEQLQNLNKMISSWVSAQRAKIAGDKGPPSPPKVPSSAAPAAAPPSLSEDETADVEKLKEQLAEKEKYIQQLEKQVADNSDALQNLEPTTAAPPSGLAGIDDLIAQYKAKIAERDIRIKELLQLIREQEDQLARIALSQLSLQDIDDAVKELEKDVEEAKKKRDELKKDGSLDPELEAIIDSIIKALAKMRKKVNNLIALEAKAKADREKARREAEEAAEAARKRAESEGEDPDKAAEDAARKARKDSEERVKKADLDTMKAAQDVEKEMKEAEKGAKKLDTGLHPHGAKWWRYRYERSYVEALIMIFISWLMLLWSVAIRKLKHKLFIWALRPGQEAESELEALEGQTHGAVYGQWLHLLSEQMMVCILVFLTVWLIAKTQLAEVFPLIITPSDEMRVPRTGQEYRTMALDICTIFFFAIMFYFGLIFSVAHDTFHFTKSLDEFEDYSMIHQRSNLESPKRLDIIKMAAANVMGTIAKDSSEYAAVKEHFVKHMTKEAVTEGDSLHKEIVKSVGGDFDRFPLSKYLRFSVRLGVAELFHFGWAMWLPVICLFITLTLLHRFAHLGYVRIMGFFALMTLALIFGISWYSKRVAKEIHDDKEAVAGQHSLVEQGTLLQLLQFVLFVMCYGVARMICQPWMWELHFWPVLGLTIVAVVSAGLFVWLVAPGIPSFVALQSIPPYLDDTDLETMLYIAKGVSREP